MKSWPCLVATLVFASACGTVERRPRVLITTPLGEMTAVVELEKAPLTSRQFLKNVDNEVYNDGRAAFYRVLRPNNQPNNPVTIQVIQGGVDRDTGDLNTDYIPHENTRATGLRHRHGTLSMARDEPGSANTEFFICIGDQPELDLGGARNPDGKGFAAFGRITSGMSTVSDIQEQPDSEQYLTSPVPIVSIRRKL